PAAVQRVAEISGGIPQTVNLLCSRALWLAEAHEQRHIGPDLVDSASRYLVGTGAPRTGGRRRALAIGAAAGLALAGAARPGQRGGGRARAGGGAGPGPRSRGGGGGPAPPRAAGNRHSRESRRAGARRGGDRAGAGSRGAASVAPCVRRAGLGAGAAR